MFVSVFVSVVLVTSVRHCARCACQQCCPTALPLIIFRVIRNPRFWAGTLKWSRHLHDWDVSCESTENIRGRELSRHLHSCNVLSRSAEQWPSPVVCLFFEFEVATRRKGWPWSTQGEFSSDWTRETMARSNNAGRMSHILPHLWPEVTMLGACHETIPVANVLSVAMVDWATSAYFDVYSRINQTPAGSGLMDTRPTPRGSDRSCTPKSDTAYSRGSDRRSCTPKSDTAYSLHHSLLNWVHCLIYLKQEWRHRIRNGIIVYESNMCCGIRCICHDLDRIGKRTCKSKATLQPPAVKWSASLAPRGKVLAPPHHL